VNAAGQFAYKPEPRERVKWFLESRGFEWLEPSDRPNILLSRTDTGFGYPERPFESLLGQYKLRRLLWCLLDKRSEGPFTVEALGQKTGCNEKSL